MPKNFDWKTKPDPGKSLPERTKMSSKERSLVEAMMIINWELEKKAKYVRPRLLQYRGGWRDLMLVKKLMEKLTMSLFWSGEISDQKHLDMVSRVGSFSVTCLPGWEGRNDGWTYVKGEDLQNIALHAIGDRCLMCTRDGKEINRCPLRKSLMAVLPPPNLGKTMGCEYGELAMEDHAAIDGVTMD